MWSLQSTWHKHWWKKNTKKKNQNDKRRLGQLSGFLRSSNRRKESQLCSEEQHEYVHWEANPRMFWWDGECISLDRGLRFVDVIRKRQIKRGLGSVWRRSLNARLRSLGIVWIRKMRCLLHNNDKRIMKSQWGVRKMCMFLIV